MEQTLVFTEADLRELLRDTILAYLDHVEVFRTGDRDACITGAIDNALTAIKDENAAQAAASAS